MPPPLPAAARTRDYRPSGVSYDLPRHPGPQRPLLGCGTRNYPLSVSGPNYCEPVSDDPIILPGLIK
jgi:hypothetical protein